MEIGILVNSDKRMEDVIGLARAAVAAGHQARVFAMDSGTRLLTKTDYTSLCEVDGITMAYCALSAGNWSVDTSGVPENIKAGDQFDNAMLQNETDKVIVL